MKFHSKQPSIIPSYSHSIRDKKPIKHITNTILNIFEEQASQDQQRRLRAQRRLFAQTTSNLNGNFNLSVDENITDNQEEEARDLMDKHPKSVIHMKGFRNSQEPATQLRIETVHPIYTNRFSHGSVGSGISGKSFGSNDVMMGSRNIVPTSPGRVEAGSPSNLIMFQNNAKNSQHVIHNSHFLNGSVARVNIKSGKRKLEHNANATA